MSRRSRNARPSRRWLSRVDGSGGRPGSRRDTTSATSTPAARHTRPATSHHYRRYAAAELRDAEVSSGARLRHAQARNCARELARRHGAVALPDASLIKHVVFNHLGLPGPGRPDRVEPQRSPSGRRPGHRVSPPSAWAGELGENPGDPWGCAPVLTRATSWCKLYWPGAA